MRDTQFPHPHTRCEPRLRKQGLGEKQASSDLEPEPPGPKPRQSRGGERQPGTIMEAPRNGEWDPTSSSASLGLADY
jgi:hypothetical protein